MNLKPLTYFGPWPLALGLVLFGCTHVSFDERKTEIRAAYESGEFAQADSLIVITQEQLALNEEQLLWLEIQQAYQDRIRIDFNKSGEDVKDYLQEYYPHLNDQMLRDWEKTGALEMKWIDGERKYFALAARNLFRIDQEAKKVWRQNYPASVSESDQFNMKHAESVMAQTMNPDPVLGETFHITFTIKLDPDAVPPGELIRCWMPFPRISAPRQTSAELISVNNEEYILADEDALQRSLYLEKETVKGEPTVFQYEASFKAAAQWFDPDELHAEPYRTDSDLYKQYTAERPPQIVFSDLVKSKSDEIVGDEKDPVQIVRKIYYWISQNIPWASALEYSIMECIPDYVLKYGHGDCGMQTFLFLSMCRYKGVPAKWQSGWHVHPGNKNLHDWSEVYFEGVGWVPVDVSFGLQPSDDLKIKDFYITGMDAYRLVINDDFSIPFSPSKKFYRSEPYDFQRGELEWDEGNLYFDQWSYSMKVRYEKEY